MKRFLLFALWALLPIGMSAQTIYTDANGLKWIQQGSDYYILISESASQTISGKAWKASDFIPDAKFRALVRSKLSTGTTDRVYRTAKSGYQTFATLTGTLTDADNKAFNFSGGLTVDANAGIQNFEGIGYFHALKVLVVLPQGITGTFNLDVTKNKSLEYLQVIDTEMKELNASGLTTLKWLDLAPSSTEISPQTKLEVININDCINLRGSAWHYGNGTAKLSINNRKANLLYLTHKDNQNRFCNIKKVYAQNCKQIKKLYCRQNMLEELDLTGCESLEQIMADHGTLTSDKIYLHGCKNLRSFIMKRQKFTDLDFLLKPSTRNGVARTAEDIAKLQGIQVNGGSYYIPKSADNAEFAGYRKDADGNPIYVTTAIREFDATYLNPEIFRQLLIANNLMTNIDYANISKFKDKLRELEFDGNLFPTVDFAGFNNKGINETTDTIRSLNANNQYVFVDAEVVKGDAVDGSKDWVAVHYDGFNTIYSMDFPGGLEIYKNRWRSEMDPTNKLRHEKDAWMCRISETQTGGIAAATFNSVMTCPEGSDDRHVFLLSKPELGNNDLDLNGCAVTYKYNTRYNQDINPTTQAPILNSDGSLKLQNTYITTRKDSPIKPESSSTINVRMQTNSYILNINPKTKQGSGVDYYSGTLCLDYDALIPKGVKVYFITGVIDTDNVLYENGTKVTEQQFLMHQFGGDGTSNNILPANTPVYVKAETQAGLYAFKPITKLNLKGWAQQRGVGEQSSINILHGMEPSDLTVKAEYQTALDNAIAEKANHTNLLSGFVGEKYSTKEEKADSTHKEFYNIEKVTEMSVTPRTILTLGREARTGKIGFWPYGGTTLPAHRCYITSDDFLNAGGLPQSNSAKGGASFLFNNFGVTGIHVVERNEPQTVSEDEWYTLQGVRLSGRPSRRGVYIHNGKKEQIQ